MFFVFNSEHSEECKILLCSLFSRDRFLRSGIAPVLACTNRAGNCWPDIVFYLKILQLSFYKIFSFHGRSLKS